MANPSIALPQSAPSGQYLTGIDEKGAIVTKAVELQEVETDAFFGGTTTSTSENTIGLTLQTYTLDDYDGKIVENTAVEFVAPDPDCCQWGVVVKVDTVNVSPAAIDVIMMGCSRHTATYGGPNGVWKIRILNPAGPDAALLAYSSTAATTLAAGDMTFPIQANKFMPINGSVFIQALGVPSVRGWAKIKVYNGTSLTVTLPANGVFGSVACTAWAILLVDGAPDGIPVGQYNGLALSKVPATTKYQLLSGATRDSSNAIDLISGSTLQKNYSTSFVAGTGNGANVLVALTGTITVTLSSAAVVGSGTAFLTDLKKGSTFTTAGGRSYTVLSVADNTHLTLNGVGNATETGVAYSRGGGGLTGSLSTFNGDPVRQVDLIRNDTTGAIDSCLVSYNAAGTYDSPPSGYTYFGIVGQLFYPAGTASVFRSRSADQYSWLEVYNGAATNTTEIVVPIPVGWSRIIATWSSVSCDTATRTMLIQVSTDGGSTYDTTAANYIGGILFYDGASVPAANAAASLSSTGNLTAAQNESGSVVISGYGTTGFKPYINTRLTSIPTTRGASGYYNSTSAITHIKFLFNGSGKFDDGLVVVSVE